MTCPPNIGPDVIIDLGYWREVRARNRYLFPYEAFLEHDGRSVIELSDSD